MSLATLANKVLGSLGVRVTRNAHANRFQAMEESLRAMARRGFAPGTIIDAGANVGEWTLMCRAIFPRAAYHMIEPQAGCASALRSITGESSDVHLHAVAVTRPGVQRVSMVGGGPSRSGTGAWVANPDDASVNAEACAATTLDELFGGELSKPVLLKLDLEGHELAALEGAEKLLRQVEVLLTETSMFDVNDSGRPLFFDVLVFLRNRGYELYDVASLSERPRDGRLRQADAVFVRRDSFLLGDRSWD